MTAGPNTNLMALTNAISLFPHDIDPVTQHENHGYHSGEKELCCSDRRQMQSQTQKRTTSNSKDQRYLEGEGRSGARDRRKMQMG